MQAVEQGDVAIRITPEGKDEIGQLMGSFSRMMERIDSLMDEKVAYGREIKNLELKALQAQINPHFLYNSLDLISCTAIVHNVPEITRMVSALAQMCIRDSRRKGAVENVQPACEVVIKPDSGDGTQRAGNENQRAFLYFCNIGEAKSCGIQRVVVGGPDIQSQYDDGEQREVQGCLLYTSVFFRVSVDVKREQTILKYIINMVKQLHISTVAAVSYTHLKLVSFFTDQYVDGYRTSYTVMTDVTELVQTRNELEMMMQAMKVSVSKHKVDEHFTVVWANDFYYQLIGYPKPEYEERFHNHCDEYFMDNPETWDILCNKIDNMCAAGEDSFGRCV